MILIMGNQKIILFQVQIECVILTWTGPHSFAIIPLLVTLHKIGEVHFRLLGTNGFLVKAKNERFTAAGWRCRQNLKYENFSSLFGRLHQKIALKSVPHVQHDYFSLFN